jgi:hypothetical protein
VAQPRSPGSAITPLSSHTDAPKAAIIPSGKVRDPAVPAAETAKCKSILRVEMAQFIGKCKHDALLSSVSSSVSSTRSTAPWPDAALAPKAKAARAAAGRAGLCFGGPGRYVGARTTRVRSPRVVAEAQAGLGPVRACVMRIGARYGAPIGLPHTSHVDNSMLLNLRQFYQKSDLEFLEAQGREVHRRPSRRSPPLMTPAGDKRLLTTIRDAEGTLGAAPLPLSNHPIALMAPVESTSLSATGTRRYIPSLGPSTRRVSIQGARRSRYQSTYQVSNRDLRFRRDLETRTWTDGELDALHAAVDEYGDMHAWHRVAAVVGEVGSKSVLDCRHRWERFGRSRARGRPRSKSSLS